VKSAVLKSVSVALVLGAVAVLYTGRPARRPAPAPTLVSRPSPEQMAFEQRALVRAHLARRVVAERIPLLEAAELFGQANGEAGMANLVRFMPGRSVREKLCRQVVDYVAAAEDEMARGGHVWTGPRLSEQFRGELDRRLAAGEFPPDPEPR
jgi:hypothetical protein